MATPPTGRTATPGYSGTPLVRKLGVAPGARVCLIDAPADYEAWVQPLPPGAVLGHGMPDAGTDLAHLFVTRREVLQERLQPLRATLRADAVLWISWPKKASKVPSTVTEDTVRELALPLGFVDVKVCAVSEVWSGLKLVVRKALR